MYGARFRTLRIVRNSRTADGRSSNNACGIFDQACLYGKIVDDVYINYVTYGFLEGMFATREVEYVDLASGRLWVRGHGFASDDEVALIGRKHVDEPPRPLRYRTKYHVVNAAADGFQLTEKANGEPVRLVNIGSGDLWVAPAGHNWPDDIVSDQCCFKAIDLSRGSDIFHPGGSTRMGRNPRTAVVDENLRTFAIKNLWVASTSVFPSGASANPTFMLILMTLRLADHLAQQHRGRPAAASGWIQ
jgi:choline dehydrogenase-like flavoprotein